MSPAINLISRVEEGKKRDDITIINDNEKEEEGEISQYMRLQKGVRNLYDNGVTKLPTKYILPVSDRPLHHHHQNIHNNFTIDLPIIDFAEFQGPNKLRVLNSIAKACEDYGFFQVINHGIESEVIEKMMDVSSRFFNLPLEEREKLMSSDMFSPVRYGTSFNQKKDGVFCWRDFLKLTCHPLSSDLLSLWPSTPVDFREAAVDYSKKTKELYVMLMDGILESLGIKKEEAEEEKGGLINNNNNNEEGILMELEEGSQIMVVNCYPSCPEPELTLGMPPHSDYGLLTLLLQDEVKGLQIHHQGSWVTVQPIPASFVVNVGDHLEIFSNGRYKSVLHRVLVNSSKSRISIASLHTLPPNRMVRPSPKLVDDANPRRYMDTDFATFLKYISSCEPKGKNFLESRKLY